MATLHRRRRSGLWFTSNTATHFTGTKDGSWDAHEMLTESISASASGVAFTGPTPVDPQLRGRIVAVRLIGAQPTGIKRAELLLFRSSNFEHATDPDQDYFISMPIQAASAEWYQLFSGAWVANASATNFDIPYIDSDGTGKFHWGLKNPKTVASQTWTDGLMIRWCW